MTKDAARSGGAAEGASVVREGQTYTDQLSQQASTLYEAEGPAGEVERRTRKASSSSSTAATTTAATTTGTAAVNAHGHGHGDETVSSVPEETEAETSTAAAADENGAAVRIEQLDSGDVGGEGYIPKVRERQAVCTLHKYCHS